MATNIKNVNIMFFLFLFHLQKHNSINFYDQKNKLLLIYLKKYVAWVHLLAYKTLDMMLTHLPNKTIAVKVYYNLELQYYAGL